MLVLEIYKQRLREAMVCEELTSHPRNTMTSLDCIERGGDLWARSWAVGVSSSHLQGKLMKA